jgi:hypothetical protein
MGKSDVLLDKTSGSKASGTAWFTDILIQKTGQLKLQIAVAEAMTLQYTIDGTNYVNGLPLAAASGYDLSVSVTAGDLFNLRQSSGGPVTVRWARVHADS